MRRSGGNGVGSTGQQGCAFLRSIDRRVRSTCQNDGDADYKTKLRGFAKIAHFHKLSAAGALNV